MSLILEEVPAEDMLKPIERLTRDLKNSAALLSPDHARYLVDLYYQLQEQRIRAASQSRTLNENGEPNSVIAWYFGNFERLEGDIKIALKRYADSQVAGRWAQSIIGIGPVIAAGLLAHIDPERSLTAGAVWRFAGLDPTVRWGKGEKRPWNARLKTLSWKIGESFVKVSNNPRDTYGKVYRDRKDLETERNEAGAFAEQAAAILQDKKIGHDTDAYAAYSQGKLPLAHIHARAKRYAVKLFLAHYQHVAYEEHFGKAPPLPYVIEHLGHVHFIAPPNWPLEEAA